MTAPSPPASPRRQPPPLPRRPSGAPGRRRAAGGAAGATPRWLAAARVLVRPVRAGGDEPSPPGTAPAGTVLVTMVATLVLALVLCGAVIERKAAGRHPNHGARQALAGAAGAASEAIGADRPAEALASVTDPLLGRTGATGGADSAEWAARARAANGAGAGGDRSVDDIVAGAGARPPDGQPTVPAAPGAGGTAVAGDGTPRLRAPTPGAPLTLWVGGDSISIEVGSGLARLAGETGLFEVVRDARPSTGLTRPDYFNWPEHLATDVAPVAGGGVDPDVVVLMFGGNDDQDMPAWAGAPAAPAGSPDWLDRYRRRVGDTMDLLKSPDDDRLVIWPGMPVTRPGTLRHVGAMNAVYASEAARRPWVRFVDSAAYFADPFGRYVPDLANADGRTRAMRSADGIHLSVAGGDRLARVVHDRLATLVDLRAAPLAPDPSESAPPNVAERPAEVVAAG